MKLQEYLNQKYNDWEKAFEVEVINIGEINKKEKGKPIGKFLEGGELDLSDFKALKRFEVVESHLLTPLTKLNVDGCFNLKRLIVSDNNLTSIDFLNDLPNPENLEFLSIYNNKIKPTDINIFSRFVNLSWLTIGNTKHGLEKGKQNRFFGSLKSYQNLTKLETICIEATDINEGLEYLPFSLAESTKTEAILDNKRGGYARIECSPHETNAKCSAIQDQLRPFNYDLEAWQLAHPNLIFQAKPHLFQREETRKKWLEAVNKKIEKTQEKLNQERGEKKIKRLKSKIRELGLIKTLTEERTIFEDSLKVGVRWYDKFKEDKATQTEFNILEVKK